MLKIFIPIIISFIATILLIGYIDFVNKSDIFFVTVGALIFLASYTLSRLLIGDSLIIKLKGKFESGLSTIKFLLIIEFIIVTIIASFLFFNELYSLAHYEMINSVLFIFVPAIYLAFLFSIFCFTIDLYKLITNADLNNRNVYFPRSLIVTYLSWIITLVSFVSNVPKMSNNYMAFSFMIFGFFSSVILLSNSIVLFIKGKSNVATFNLLVWIVYSVIALIVLIFSDFSLNGIG